MSAVEQRQRDRHGQAAVEFALVLPFLLIMLVGIVEFGRAWNQHQVITDAARAAARIGSLHDDQIDADSIENTAQHTLAAAGIDPNDATITLTNWDGDPNTAITVAIDLPYRFTFFGPLVRWTTGRSDIVLKTAFSMRNE